jgi:hypothetical protein
VSADDRVTRKRDYYSRGTGFELSVKEAVKLIAAGVPEDEILEAIGFPPTNQRALEAARRRIAARAATKTRDVQGQVDRLGEVA